MGNYCQSVGGLRWCFFTNLEDVNAAMLWQKFAATAIAKFWTGSLSTANAKSTRELGSRDGAAASASAEAAAAAAAETSLFLSLSPFLSLFLYLSICLSIYLSLALFLCVSLSLSLFPLSI